MGLVLTDVDCSRLSSPEDCSWNGQAWSRVFLGWRRGPSKVGVSRRHVLCLTLPNSLALLATRSRTKMPALPKSVAIFTNHTPRLIQRITLWPSSTWDKTLARLLCFDSNLASCIPVSKISRLWSLFLAHRTIGQWELGMPSEVTKYQLCPSFRNRDVVTSWNYYLNPWFTYHVIEWIDSQKMRHIPLMARSAQNGGSRRGSASKQRRSICRFWMQAFI